MLIPFVLLVPHIPTLLLDAHRRHRTEMLAALEVASGKLKDAAPDVIAALSARWISKGAFLVDDGSQHATLIDYTGFGVEARYDCAGAPVLAKALITTGQKAGARVAAGKRGVDSGVTVPMRFLVPDRSVPVVPLSLALETPRECRAWGAILRRMLAARPERVARVIGGLITFDPHAWQLGRDVPELRDLDARVLAALGAGDWNALEAVRRDGAAAGERVQTAMPLAAELRHLEVLRGVVGDGARGTLLAYETGAGVGTALMEFAIEDA